MSTKTYNSRIQNKHDLEVNWLQAKNFVPLKGELIVYDAEVDENGSVLTKVVEDETVVLLPEGRAMPYTYVRFKIGDGITNVNELPFASVQKEETHAETETFAHNVTNTKNEYIIKAPAAEGEEAAEAYAAAGMIYNPYGVLADEEEDFTDAYNSTDELIVEGKGAFATGRNIKIVNNYELGEFSNYATAFGAHHIIEGYGSFTAGVNNTVSANAKYAMTVGNNIYTNGSRATAFGEGTNKLNKILENKNLTAADIASLTAEEFEALLRPERANIAWGDFSFVSGRDNIAFGKHSATIGEWLYAGGDHSVVFGYANRVFGKESVVFGNQNNNNANSSLIVGSKNNINARDDGNGYNLAAGFLNNVVGKYSFTAGYGNTNAGDGTVALGWANRIGSKTSGQGSVVMGKENVVDTGFAVATGNKSYTNHYASAVLGLGLKSTRANATVVGQFNKPKSTLLFSVGNGTGTAADITITDDNTMIDGNTIVRSNALEVHQDGHAEIALVGDTDNSLTTKKYVDDVKTYLDDKLAESSSGIEQTFSSNRSITLNNLSQPACKINASLSLPPLSYGNQIQNSDMSSEWDDAWSSILTLTTDTEIFAPDSITQPLEKVLRIGAMDATDKQILKYYKAPLGLEIGQSYTLTLKVRGKISISLVGSNGIGDGSGWVTFNSPHKFTTFTHQFTCVGRSNGTAENPGWTFGFGLQKGQVSEGAWIDDVVLTKTYSLKASDANGETVVIADAYTGKFPEITTTSKSVTLTLDVPEDYAGGFYGTYVQEVAAAIQSIRDDVIQSHSEYAFDSAENKLAGARFVEDYFMHELPSRMAGGYDPSKDYTYDTSSIASPCFVKEYVENNLPELPPIGDGLTVKKLNGLTAEEAAEIIASNLPYPRYTSDMGKEYAMGCVYYKLNGNIITVRGYEYDPDRATYLSNITTTSKTLNIVITEPDDYSETMITISGYGCPGDVIDIRHSAGLEYNEDGVPAPSIYLTTFTLELPSTTFEDNTIYYIGNPNSDSDNTTGNIYLSKDGKVMCLEKALTKETYYDPDSDYTENTNVTTPNFVREVAITECQSIMENLLIFAEEYDGWKLQMQNGEAIGAYCVYSTEAERKTEHRCEVSISLPPDMLDWQCFVATYNEGVFLDAMVSYCEVDEDRLKVNIYVPEGIAEDQPCGMILSVIARP